MDALFAGGGLEDEDRGSPPPGALPPHDLALFDPVLAAGRSRSWSTSRGCWGSREGPHLGRIQGCWLGACGGVPARFNPALPPPGAEEEAEAAAEALWELDPGPGVPGGGYVAQATAQVRGALAREAAGDVAGALSCYRGAVQVLLQGLPGTGGKLRHRIGGGKAWVENPGVRAPSPPRSNPSAPVPRAPHPHSNP